MWSLCEICDGVKFSFLVFVLSFVIMEIGVDEILIKILIKVFIVWCKIRKKLKFSLL